MRTPHTSVYWLYLCHMSSVRSTSDGRGPVTRKGSGKPGVSIHRNKTEKEAHRAVNEKTRGDWGCGEGGWCSMKSDTVHERRRGWCTLATSLHSPRESGSVIGADGLGPLVCCRMACHKAIRRVGVWYSPAYAWPRAPSGGGWLRGIVYAACSD